MVQDVFRKILQDKNGSQFERGLRSFHVYQFQFDDLFAHDKSFLYV